MESSSLIEFDCDWRRGVHGPLVVHAMSQKRFSDLAVPTSNWISSAILS